MRSTEYLGGAGLDWELGQDMPNGNRKLNIYVIKFTAK